jgi:hypothetical protein
MALTKRKADLFAKASLDLGGARRNPAWIAAAFALIFFSQTAL